MREAKKKSCPICGGTAKQNGGTSFALESPLACGESLSLERYACDLCGGLTFYESEAQRRQRHQEREERERRREFQEKVSAGLVGERPFVCPSCGSMRRDRVCPVCGDWQDLRAQRRGETRAEKGRTEDMDWPKGTPERCPDCGGPLISQGIKGFLTAYGRKTLFAREDIESMEVLLCDECGRCIFRMPPPEPPATDLDATFRCTKCGARGNSGVCRCGGVCEPLPGKER